MRAYPPASFSWPICALEGRSRASGLRGLIGGSRVNARKNSALAPPDQSFIRARSKQNEMSVREAGAARSIRN